MPIRKKDSADQPAGKNMDSRWAFKTPLEKLMSATGILAGLAGYMSIMTAVVSPAIVAVIAAVRGARYVNHIRRTRKRKDHPITERFSFVRLPEDHPHTRFINAASAKISTSPPSVYAGESFYCYNGASHIIITPSVIPVLAIPNMGFLKIQLSPDSETRAYAAKSPSEKSENSFYVAHELAHQELNGVGAKLCHLVSKETTKIIALTSAATALGRSMDWPILEMHALANTPFLEQAAFLLTAQACASLGFKYSFRINEMQADRLGSRLIPDKKVSLFSLIKLDPTDYDMAPTRLPLRLMFRDLTSDYPSTIRRAWALVQEGKKNPEGTCPYELSRQEWGDTLASPAPTKQNAHIYCPGQ